MCTTDTGFRYAPNKLVPQWDAAVQRFSYRHPNPPSVIALGLPDTHMGYTEAGAQEMCRLANIDLMRREQWARARAAGTAWDPLMSACLDTVLARERHNDRRRVNGRIRHHLQSVGIHGTWREGEDG